MGVVSRRGLLAAGAALACVGRARAEAGFSLRNARLVVGDGTELTGGVRVEGGKIVEVGPSVTSGEDLGGQTLHPGFWECGSGLGLHEIDLEGETHDDAEGSDAILPQARVVDGYNPASALIPVTRQFGVLGGLILPSGGLVGGQAAWMRFAGENVADATLAASAGVVFNLGRTGTGGLPNQPKTRIGVAMKIRDLLDANKPPEPPKKGKKAGKEEDPPTRAQQALRGLRKRELRAIFRADRADDMLTALDIAKEFQLDAVLLGCVEGHKIARELAAAGFPVLLGPVTAQPDSFEHLDAVYENAALLAKAGVRFGLRQGGMHNLRDLTAEACVAVAHGLSREHATAAVMGNGPGFWGLPVGLLKEGHEANLVRCDGDPLQPRTRTTGVWVRGEAMPLVSHQTELLERFRELR